MEKPTRKEATDWKCSECRGNYADGKVDCENPVCSLYFWMPYRKKEPNYDWRKYSPRAKGLVLKEDRKKELTDEQRAAMAARLNKAREKSTS